MVNSSQRATISCHPLRREQIRYNLNAEARICIGQVETSITLCDISARGARGISTVPLAPDQPVNFSMQPPVVRSALQERGKIAWSRQLPDGRYEAGLRLDAIDISNIVSSYLRSETYEPRVYSADLKPVETPEMILSPHIKLAPSPWKTIVLLIIAAALIATLIAVWNGTLKLQALLNPSAANLRIEAVLYDPAGESIVYINDEVVKVGQSINGFTLTRIDTDSITLTDPSGDETIIATGDVPQSATL
jgi:hypothetical protein